MLSPRLLSALFVSGSLVLFAPGCSSNAAPVAQAGIVATIAAPAGASAATCEVAGADTFTVGVGGTSDGPVQNGSSWNGAPLSVQCTVSGNDTSGFNVIVQAQYGVGVDELGSLFISGHFDGTTNAQTGISGTFYANQLSESLAEAKSSTDPGCTVTFTTQPLMGIASGRVWGHIDCPAAVNANSGASCEASADFRFENCSQ